MGVWRDVVIGMKMSRDVGPSRRDRSPSQGWSHRKGPSQWYVKRQVDLVLVGGSLVWALDEGLLNLIPDEEPRDARRCWGGVGETPHAPVHALEPRSGCPRAE